MVEKHFYIIMVKFASIFSFKMSLNQTRIRHSMVFEFKGRPVIMEAAKKICSVFGHTNNIFASFAREIFLSLFLSILTTQFQQYWTFENLCCWKVKAKCSKISGTLQITLQSLKHHHELRKVSKLRLWGPRCLFLSFIKDLPWTYHWKEDCLANFSWVKSSTVDSLYDQSQREEEWSTL